MNKISREFLIRLKLHSQPMYRISRKTGAHPNWLPKAISGIEATRPSDPRIAAIGRLLGPKESECFEPSGKTNPGSEAWGKNSSLRLRRDNG